MGTINCITIAQTGIVFVCVIGTTFRAFAIWFVLGPLQPMNETNKAEDSCPSFIRFCAVLEACKCIDCQPISWIRIFVARSACWFKVKLYICCFNRYRPWAVRTDVNRVQRCLAKGMPFKVLHTGGTSGSRKRKMAVEERLKKLKLQKGMNGRVDVCIYKVSDDAGNCWRRFERANAALWQVSSVTK